MAVMTTQQRFNCWAEFMRTQAATTGDLSKAELRAFFDAADQWISDKQAEFNAAIPQPARSAMTAADKARGFALILRHRYIAGV